MIRRNLLDLNVLIALTEPCHTHHKKARNWFTSTGKESWGICPFTETGFLRITTNPAFGPGPRTMGQAIAVLQSLKKYPGFCYWQINKSWLDLTARFAGRIFGHQQVTDAYLLGLAIAENGVLATFDRAIIRMAGREFAGNVFLVE